MQGTVIATLGRVFWRMANELNLDADRMFRDAGLDPARVEGTRDRLPVERLWNMIRAIADITDNPALGLRSHEFYHPFDLHALGVTFLASRTLADALHRLDRYERVISSNVDYTVVDRGNRVDLTSQGRELPEDVLRLMNDLEVSLLVDLCRQGIGGVFDPVEVAFAHPEPDDLAPYQEQFRCQLRFSAALNTITFLKSDLTRPLNASNRELVVANDQVLDEILLNLTDGGVVSQVKSILINQLPSGAPSQAVIADIMLTSSRTLSRRLAEHGTNFRALVAEVRRDLASKYVRENKKPLTEVSYLLGFSDLSSFSRAFKRWFGEAPNAMRASLNTG